jgi:hypothetical protein
MREWIKAWLERPDEPKGLPEVLALEARCQKLEERVEDIAKHFVIQYDPATKQPVRTLADEYAKEDGKPKPAPLRRGRNWDQKRRFLEAVDAAKTGAKN